MASPTRVPVPGTSGDDLLVARPEPSLLSGGDGDDILIDGPGSDSLHGGDGSNRLYGGPGSDYYTHDMNVAGRNEILDFDPSPSGGDVNRDTLLMDDIMSSFRPFQRRDDDLLIGVNGKSGAVTIKYFFLDPAFRIEVFRFGDTTVTDEQILRNFHIDPGMPLGRSADNPPAYTGDRIRLTGDPMDADRLVAGDRATYIRGHGGNDLLIGSRYSDVLDGGSSKPLFLGDNYSDRLYGAAGNDFYRVDLRSEFSSHRLYDYDPTPGNLDILHIHSFVGTSNLYMSGAAGGDLTIALSTEQHVVIENYFLDRAFVIEEIRFDDGSVLDEAAIRQRVGLPPPVSPPQASLNVPQPASVVEAPPPGDGWLSLALLAGAALSGG